MFPIEILMSTQRILEVRNNGQWYPSLQEECSLSIAKMWPLDGWVGCKGRVIVYTIHSYAAIPSSETVGKPFPPIRKAPEDI